MILWWHDRNLFRVYDYPVKDARPSSVKGSLNLQGVLCCILNWLVSGEKASGLAPQSTTYGGVSDLPPLDARCRRVLLGTRFVLLVLRLVSGTLRAPSFP